MVVSFECVILVGGTALALGARQGRFALNVASKALEYYAETVFKVPYPLNKSDLLAIPGNKLRLVLSRADCSA